VDSSVDTASGTIITGRACQTAIFRCGRAICECRAKRRHDAQDDVHSHGCGPTQPEGPFVYVIKPDSTVIRPVQVALTEGDNTAISEG
jgi:multidrug efflux system membrane fusion protein